MKASVLPFACLLFLAASPLNAQTPLPDPDAENVVNQELVFSAPPRESATVGSKRYQPVADYLSKVLGRKVVYKHPGTWGAYRTEMLQGDYDIVFDGPHFNSYRAEKMRHNILAKIPVAHQFVIIVHKSNIKTHSVPELAGQTFCTHAPPNLGTLSLLNHFQNPARQPAIVNTQGWKNIYVVAGRISASLRQSRTPPKK